MMKPNNERPMKPDIITIVGKSNSGKTTLLEKIIKELTLRGYKLGTAKHTHDGFDIDKEGKDSFRHRQAGAASTLVISTSKIALIKEEHADFADRMRCYLSDRDIIIAEGFKHLDLPKIEIFRTGSIHKTPLFLKDKHLIAFVTDSDYRPEVPVFNLEDIQGLSDFIENTFLKD